MSDNIDTAFSAEEICAQAQENVAALLLATMAYLREHGEAGDDWIGFLGRTFAPGWEYMRGRSALDIARAAARNHVSGGGQLVSLQGDQDRAEAVIVWPGPDMLGFAGVSRYDINRIHNIFYPIAEYLGLHYSWQEEREGEQVRIAFSRQF